MARKLIFALLFLPVFSWAQQEPVKTPDSRFKGVSLPAHIIDGDTIPYVNLAPVLCMGERTFKSKKDQQRWERTKYNVKKSKFLPKYCQKEQKYTIKKRRHRLCQKFL